MTQDLRTGSAAFDATIREWRVMLGKDAEGASDALVAASVMFLKGYLAGRKDGASQAQVEFTSGITFVKKYLSRLEDL